MSERASLSRVAYASLRGHEWPQSFRATTVNALTGDFRVLGPLDRVPLEVGVVASGALPKAFPPIIVDGAPYIDGGVRSMLNADVARGAENVVVSSCFALDAGGNVPPEIGKLNAALQRELAQLRSSGSKVVLLEPNAAFIDLTAGGTKMLDPALAAPAFELGRSEAAMHMLAVDSIWTC